MNNKGTKEPVVYDSFKNLSYKARVRQILRGLGISAPFIVILLVQNPTREWFLLLGGFVVFALLVLLYNFARLKMEEKNAAPPAEAGVASIEPSPEDSHAGTEDTTPS